jgi:hypothetical protein
MGSELAPLLVQALAPEAPDDQASDIERHLDELLDEKGTHPVVGLLVRRLAEQEATRSERRVSDRELRELLETIRTELDMLRTRSDALAAALGSCPACWGTDPRCPTCHGGGGPGWARPHPPSFARWVAPALERARPPTDREQPTTTRGDEHGQHP